MGTLQLVDCELLKRLGAIVLAAGRVESQMHDIAWALGLDPSRLQAVALKGAISDRLVADPPGVAHDLAEGIGRWLDRAVSALDRRNELFHSITFERRAEDRWYPERKHLKSGEYVTVTSEDLVELGDRMKGLFRQGGQLEQRLLPQPRKGIFIRRPRSRSDPWILAVELDGEYPERPTESELDEWWQRYSPSWGLPPDW